MVVGAAVMEVARTSRQAFGQSTVLLHPHGRGDAAPTIDLRCTPSMTRSTRVQLTPAPA